jgi:hypothetical protein
LEKYWETGGLLPRKTQLAIGKNEAGDGYFNHQIEDP